MMLFLRKIGGKWEEIFESILKEKFVHIQEIDFESGGI